MLPFKLKIAQFIFINVNFRWFTHSTLVRACEPSIVPCHPRATLVTYLLITFNCQIRQKWLENEMYPNLWPQYDLAMRTRACSESHNNISFDTPERADCQSMNACAMCEPHTLHVWHTVLSRSCTHLPIRFDLLCCRSRFHAIRTKNSFCYVRIYTAAAATVMAK